ncbi:MAG: hypothetical protein APF84_16835 [Gracilibacter sp. BRH_c7a]|nr:MAG: hypothetical protein APF84_16835 [Gracilibacter sp. BRH_c7a]
MDKKPYDGPHFFDDPPEFHYGLLDYGERPYWTPDGKKLAFIENSFGDVCEIDLETKVVRNLTKDKGLYHSFLRVLVLPNGDYLLIGPRDFKNYEVSRHVESELWILDKEAKNPPKPLGRRIFEGCAVSAIANRIAYSMNGNHDSSIGTEDDFEIHVTEIVYGADGPELGEDRVVYKAKGRRVPEPQDFRYDDKELIFAEYVNRFPKRDTTNWKCVVKGVHLETGEVQIYIDEPMTHNECEGIFPDHEYITLESSCDFENYWPPIDLWKLKLDGSGERVRMTQSLGRAPWRCSNCNVSPDGKWLAFMVNTRTDAPGLGRGIGLLDLEAWEKSPQGQLWETPAERKIYTP